MFDSAASSTGRWPLGPGQRSTARCAGTRSSKPCSCRRCTIRRCTASSGIRMRAPSSGAGVVEGDTIVKRLDKNDGQAYVGQVTLPKTKDTHMPSSPIEAPGMKIQFLIEGEDTADAI